MSLATVLEFCGHVLMMAAMSGICALSVFVIWDLVSLGFALRCAATLGVVVATFGLLADFQRSSLSKQSGAVSGAVESTASTPRKTQ